MAKKLIVKGRPDMEIIGTADTMECCALIDPERIVPGPDGAISIGQQPDPYEGETKVYWDTQVQKKDGRGIPLWQADDGTEWPEDQLELIDEGPED